MTADLDIAESQVTGRARPGIDKGKNILEYGGMAIATLVMNETLRDVPFSLDGRRVPKARSVSLVGAFNRWDTFAHRMTLGPDNWWTISLALAPGKYPYLFIVDGVPWTDLCDDGRVPNAWGGGRGGSPIRHSKIWRIITGKR